LGFVFADNEDNAKIKFLNSTVCADSIGEIHHENSLNYWKIGVDIWEVKEQNWEIIRGYLNDYFSLEVAVATEKRVKDRAQIDFFFHSYCNYS